MLNQVTSQGIRHALSIVALFAIAAAMGGCAVAPSKPESIVPPTVGSAKQHPQTVSVLVAGGVDTNPSTRLRLTNATVSEGLVASINKYHVFSRVISGAGADYVLAVTMVSGDFPSFAATFTVKAELAWSLKRADGTTVWQQVIRTEGTATGGEAFAGVERAVRENVAQGLAKLADLNL